jgi:hypothetical protein
MIRRILSIGILVVLSGLILSCEPAPSEDPDNSGVIVYLNLGYSTTINTGVYIWVTDELDNYVCTINYYLTNKGDGLLTQNHDEPNDWQTDSGTVQNGTIDGVSRATQTINSGTTLSFASSKWDLTDASSNTVGNGVYTIHAQVTGDGTNGNDYYSADINIDGTAKTVDLVAGTAVYVVSGSVSYIP